MKDSNLAKGYILKGTDYSYRIEGVLGQGSFGITYLATTKVMMVGKLGNIETEVKVAIKEFFMKEFSSRHEDGTITEMTGGSIVQNYARKFRKEAENLAKLSHPGIVNVLEVFDANNTCYYAMQYIAGGSLDSYVKRHGGLPETEAICCIRQIGEAVQYMHDHRMLHLDLKPGNVMRSDDGSRMVLIDFGLSKQYTDDGNPESSTTIGLGTPGYAPIEQSNADRDKDFAPTLDVYALGATFYKLLTCQTPPVASEVNDEGLPTDVLRQKGVSERSISAIERAMEPRKSKRVKSVTEFLNLLSSSSPEDEATVIEKTAPFSKPDPQPTTGPTPQPQPNPIPSPRRYPKWLIGVLGGLSIAAAVYFIGNRGRQTPVDVVIDSDQSQATASSTTGTHNGHEWIDLGLSVKWATCNVGASSPSDYGSYFAWGETSPKSEYTWSNLKYCNDTTGDSFSKYNQDQAGTKDNKTTLELGDDAARSNWGGSWRMPTISEFQELKDNCTWTWTTQNGKNGYKVVSKSNGNSIFLPAAGYRYGTSLSNAGSYGYYWSGSLGESLSYGARGLYFDSDYHGTRNSRRRYGRSVRPVLR